MPARKTPLVNGEIYHIYNHAIEGRNLFVDEDDLERFLISLREFNAQEPIGSLYEHTFQQKNGDYQERTPVVEIISYCLLPNHYHILLRQLEDGGVTTLMHKIGGYAQYYNRKYNRRAKLFEGRYKAAHIDTSSKLRRILVYVNFNDRVHDLKGGLAKLVRSSRSEILRDISDICTFDIIKEEFGGGPSFLQSAEEIFPEIMGQRDKREVDYVLE